MSYKREIFDIFVPYIEGTYCSDTEFHWRLGQKGFRLRFVPAIQVNHYNIERLGQFLKHEFHHGRSFARVRSGRQDFTRARRYLYILFSALIPLKLLLKRVEYNLKNKIYLHHFIKSMPLVLIGLISWSIGEFVGYIEHGRQDVDS